jgi:hypothetical protein
MPIGADTNLPWQGQGGDSSREEVSGLEGDDRLAPQEGYGGIEWLAEQSVKDGGP